MALLEVYKITNRGNGKVYVGITNQGIKVRWYKHCSDVNAGSHFALHNAIRKYGKDNFQVEILETVDDVEVLKEREIYWIGFYSSYDRSKGYNLTLGGDGTFGRYHSNETKDKIRQKATGRKYSVEAKEKMRHRKNVNRRIYQYDLEGKLVNVFESASAAARVLNVNRFVIGAVARGYRKTAYGFTWKYVCDAE